MSYFSEFVGGSAPVGSIVQGPYNLTDPAYLPCDGRKVSRITYPLLSACLSNVGTFTSTNRVKPVTSVNAAICTHGLNFVMSGIAGGAGGMLTTPDGITFTQRATPVSTTVVSLISDGTNIVGATTGAVPVYSTDGGSTFAATATAGTATSTNVQTAMAHAPTLGANGRFCIANVSATQVATSDDRGVLWTLRTHGLGFTVMHVCWTGTKYLATLNTAGFVGVSADGISWALQAMPFRTSVANANGGGIVSDGAGKVLWIDAANTLIFTSTDHGANWSKRSFGTTSNGSIPGQGSVYVISMYLPSFANSRFFVSISSTFDCSFFCSSDLQSWVPVMEGFSTSRASPYAVFAHKSGVYLFNDAATTFLQTMVEDATRMYLPNNAQSESNNSNNFLPFIKVQ